MFHRRVTCPLYPRGRIGDKNLSDRREDLYLSLCAGAAQVYFRVTCDAGERYLPHVENVVQIAIVSDSVN